MSWPEGVDRRVLAEVTSTSAEAARLAPTVSRPTWILGLRQTAGKGRRGRSWMMPEGNFAASLVMPCADPPPLRALRSFVAALALRDAVTRVAGGGADLALKWPNDVLLGGGKLAGILLESLSGTLVIGIGVNLVAVPRRSALEPGALRPVSLLDETGVAVDAETFLEALATAFALWEARFRAEGFEPVRQAWLDHAARLGERVTARAGAAETVGIFETVDGSGALVLATPRGPVHVAAADVYF